MSWLSDHLTTTQGFTTSAIEQFCITTATTAKSQAALITQLENAGIQDTHSFAQRLFAQYNTTRATNNNNTTRNEKPREKIVERKYEILLHDEEEDQQPARPKKKAGETKHKHVPVQMQTEHEKSLARKRDVIEKQEFEEKLREKDELKKKAKMEPTGGDPKRMEIANNKQARNEQLPEIREISRQKYLEKREKEQLLLLEMKLNEEQQLFRNVELSEKEKAKAKSDRKILELAKLRSNMDDKTDAYMMPQGNN